MEQKQEKTSSPKLASDSKSAKLHKPRKILRIVVIAGFGFVLLAIVSMGVFWLYGRQQISRQNNKPTLEPTVQDQSGEPNPQDQSTTTTFSPGKK